MCNSPTANYYKPTDEPEPWDLTQLNIEASMMCLVSKVKFLCGRVGSPAVRLRSQKKFTTLKQDPEQQTNQRLVSIQRDFTILLLNYVYATAQSVGRCCVRTSLA
jgi:hypothetical protein